MGYPDPERSLSIEKENEKLEANESEDEDEVPPFPRQPPAAKTREHSSSATAVPAQGADNEDVIDLVRGRRQHSVDSLGSNSSSDDDSQRTDSNAHDHEVPTKRPSSRAHSAARSLQREPVVVPREQRRGLFAQCALIAEVTDAQDYARRTKWTITTVVSLAAVVAPMGASIILPGLVDITRDLHTTATTANLSVAMYMLAMGLFPLWWSTFSEAWGRRSIYLVSFALFVVLTIVAGLSVNIAMFVIMRIIAGGAAASVQAVGAGTIADVWEVKERGRAMGMFYLGPLCGPLLSPILGGIFSETLGWRWTMYFMSILGALLAVMIFFLLPETLKVRKPVAAAAEQEAVVEVVAVDEKTHEPPPLARTTTQQSVKIKSRKALIMARRMLVDPLRIVVYLQFPSVAICVFYASVTFSGLYMLNVSVQEAFSAPPYNYSSIIVGLLYLPNSFGYFLSSIFGGRWVDHIMHREARKAGRYDEKGRLIFRPEDRMKENAWLGAALYPAGLLIYGWTTQYKTSVAIPLVANFLFGVGTMLIFAVATTMLTEYMPRKASSGVALNNCFRNIAACVLVAVTEPLIRALGTGWLFTIVALVSLLSGFVTFWAMKRYGDRWRDSMDKKMDKVMGD